MSWEHALLMQQEPIAIPIWWHGGGQTMAESTERNRLQTVKVYTPNNRCRPEAPLTSLPKLTPVKNVEEDRRVEVGEKGRTSQDKK